VSVAFEGPAVADSRTLTEREIKIARILRPLGRGPLVREQAARAAQLLDVHPSTVYRLRARYLRDPIAESLLPGDSGRLRESRRLPAPVEAVLTDVVERWLPRQRELAHPVLDTHMEVRGRCHRAGLESPSRNTVARRMAAHRQAQLAHQASLPGAEIAPGSFGASRPLEIVQIDHTQADVLIVDAHSRQVIGRPWLSVAIDLASRTIPAFFLGMERPSAATVALLMSRVIQPKDQWLAHLGLTIDWPMAGIPKTLHMDNAAEFRSRALRLGCAQYGIEVTYRPVGRPNYGGHIERMNRTLMQRLKGLPGATGNSPKGRKARKPEKFACLTLLEFERWLALEVGQRYHRSEHRGLQGATPHAAWTMLCTAGHPPRQLPPGPEEVWRLLINFMPLAHRSVQADGLTLFHIRYWHPVFVVWRVDRRHVRVRYHPEDLSRIFVSADGRHYVEARYADLRRPSITLWEQRAAVKSMKANNQPRISEALLFQAIGQQRQVVERARRDTKRVKAGRPASNAAGIDFSKPARPKLAPAAKPSEPSDAAVDYDKPVEAFNVEIWR
jgi:putative transposase